MHRVRPPGLQNSPSRVRPQIRPAFAALLLAGLLAPAAQATLVPRMTLEEIVDASQSVVHGTVLRTWAEWDSGRKFIWTHYEIRVADALRGGPSATIVVSEPGGTVGETAMQIVGTPHYDVGEEVVLFAVRTPIGYLRTCGWGQGKFKVSRPEGSSQALVRSAAAGVELVERPAGDKPSQPRVGTALTGINGLPLEEFKTRVRQMIESRPVSKER